MTEQAGAVLEAVGPTAEAGTLPVVGIGVFAASLWSLETLFGDIGTDFGAAYPIAVRWQEGTGRRRCR